jgi:hypothetical protein
LELTGGDDKRSLRCAAYSVASRSPRDHSVATAPNTRGSHCRPGADVVRGGEPR